MSEYKAQLLAVEAKLAKDPQNEELLSLKENLLELISLSCELEEEDEIDLNKDKTTVIDTTDNNPLTSQASSSQDAHKPPDGIGSKTQNKNPTEADLLARKREINRKKRAKLREKLKEQTAIAESEKQSWQSFANKKGLKGVTKKSIFAAPCTVTGKVGVGTNGIADAPSASTIAFGQHKY